MKKLFTLVVILILFVTISKAQDIQIFNSTTNSVFSGNNFKSIGVSKDGYIWAGTQYQGLYVYDPTTFVWSKLDDLTNVFINDIKPDKFGGIWIAQSGLSGGGSSASNSAGGVNYYSSRYASTALYSFTPSGGLVSRNVRSVWVDTNRVNISAFNPRVWAVQQTFITGSDTKAGGISNGLNSNQPYFSNVTNGLKVVPYVNQYVAGTPSCISIGGDKNEMWVGTIQNFNGGSQILRYQPNSQNGSYLGAYDATNVPQLPGGFRANAIYFDNEGRQWVGLSNGGVVVKNGDVWKTVNMAPIFTAGAVVNLCAITGDSDGNIYIGTSAGLIIYSGGAVDDVASYQVYKTADGLPSNNITNMAFDNKTGRLLIASDAGVAFWQRKKKIKVELVWDNSFPIPGTKPRGVVADGVARLYFKVKRGTDTIPQFKKVEVSLNDYDANSATLRGKVKKADYALLNKYSGEASDATTQASRTDSTDKGEFWFWYVSPEDFSVNNTSAYASMTERKDSVKVLITYGNDRKDSVYLAVRVVRPPLVLVHGLASYPAAWDGFKNGAGIPFLGNDLYKYKHALKMDGRGAFIDNAKMLVAGDIGLGQADAKLNTLQGNIEQIREMGFAANQVYYVCHSMGGLMARSTIRWYADKFYADGGYKYNNYGKGFIHELITINSPHNGAVASDLIGEYIPQAPMAVNVILNDLYLNYPESPIPFDFVVPDKFGLTSKYGPSLAVANLSISKKWGGIKQVPTKVRYHMICGDVQLVPAFVSTVLADVGPLISLFNNVLEAGRALSPPPFKAILTGFLRLGQVAGALSFLEWAHQRYDVPGYLNGSDLIVPLTSETAKQSPTTTLHITQFTGFSAWHSSILSRTDVGQRVQDILNTKVSSNFFGDIIPGNNVEDPVGARPMATNYNTITTNFDTSKIAIAGPSRSDIIFADSIINIKFRLKDTVGLAYVRVHFQNTDSLTFINTASQTIPFKVDPAFVGAQKIFVTAVYDKPDSTKYYIDTLSLGVQNKAPLQGFKINNHLVEVISGTPYYASYSVKYNDIWVPLSGNDNNIMVTFSPAGTVNYDSSSYNAVQNGFTQAYISYKGFKDTVSFNSEVALYVGCLNKTIAGGSFKNPAIWSKGVVPDLCDSVVINAGHAVIADSSLTCSSLRINSGGSLTVNNAAVALQLGETDEAVNILDNYGALNLSNGKLTVSGRVKLNAASTFNMTGGNLVIDGNTGSEQTSLPDNLYLFDVSSSLQSFSFTGGTIQVTDPPLGANSQAINCSYIFGDNSILKFGNGVSTTKSNNTIGFGGNHLPSQIGNFILDAGTLSNNRIFINLSPLTVKKSLQVKSGNLIQSAPLNIKN